MGLVRSVAIAGMLLAGCGWADGPVAIWTRPRPDDACLQANVGGVLVADPDSGLAFKGVDGGANLRIRWPFGWTARRENGVVLLISPKGKVTAREGDRIDGGGGYSSDPNGSDVSVGVYCAFNVTPGAGGPK